MHFFDESNALLKIFKFIGHSMERDVLFNEDKEDNNIESKEMYQDLLNEIRVTKDRPKIKLLVIFKQGLVHLLLFEMLVQFWFYILNRANMF